MNFGLKWVQNDFWAISSNLTSRLWTWPCDLDLDLSRSQGHMKNFNPTMFCQWYTSHRRLRYAKNGIFSHDLEVIGQGHRSKSWILAQNGSRMIFGHFQQSYGTLVDFSRLWLNDVVVLMLGNIACIYKSFIKLVLYPRNKMTHQPCM